MALARTTPKKPAKKPAKRKASTKWPTEWPIVGYQEFNSLPAEDQAWIRHASPWLHRADVAGDPSCMVRHQEFEAVKANREYYYPFMVKYFRTSPRTFDFALRYFTGKRMHGQTIAGIHKRWQEWLTKHLLGRANQIRQAAE